MRHVKRDFGLETRRTVATKRENVREARRRSRRRQLVGTAGVGAVLVFVAIACAGQGMVRLNGGHGAATVGARPYDEVTVQSGDTLWAIAVTHGDPSRDPRATVDELRRINGLRSASLRVGDVLLVPASR